MSARYLVLDSDPHDDSLRWSLDRQLPALLPELGFEYRQRQRDHETLARDVWEAEGTRAILTLVSDLQTPAHYVQVEAGTDELVDEIAAKLPDALPVLALTKLQERAARPEDDPSALVRLALGADPFEPDERTRELIAAGLAHEQAAVRVRAAEAAALAPSAELLPRLEALAREDEDGGVRDMAARAASACRPARS